MYKRQLESFGDLETEEIAKKYESSPPAADRSAEGGEAPKKPDAPSTHDTTQQNPGGESSPPSSLSLIHICAFISLTIDQVYLFQKYLMRHSVTLMADGQKLPCICME